MELLKFLFDKDAMTLQTQSQQFRDGNIFWPQPNSLAQQLMMPQFSIDRSSLETPSHRDI
jgi:hypothetical protein